MDGQQHRGTRDWQRAALDPGAVVVARRLVGFPVCPGAGYWACRSVYPGAIRLPELTTCRYGIATGAKQGGARARRLQLLLYGVQARDFCLGFLQGAILEGALVR